jgi:hypothetical protein
MKKRLSIVEEQQAIFFAAKTDSMLTEFKASKKTINRAKFSKGLGKLINNVFDDINIENPLFTHNIKIKKIK